MRRLVLAALVAALAAPAAAAAQPWPHRPDSPIDLAARERAERERLRALADQREATVRADQLRSEITRHRLDSARGPVVAPPPGPVFTPAPLPGQVEREDALREDADRRLQDTARRLAEMDAWLAGPR